MHLTKEDLHKTDKIFRLNLINSMSGINPANLIGTMSDHGKLNLAIFSSVFHLGSNPALMGMICRPTGDVPRHTFDNIETTGQYTINAVPEKMSQQAHYTSAKFDSNESEFQRCRIEPAFIKNFNAPFVAESPLKMGMKLKELIPIKTNDTVMIVGEVMHIMIQDDLVTKEGYITLDRADIVGIGGLNSYYQLKQLAIYPYARVSELPKFD